MKFLNLSIYSLLLMTTLLTGTAALAHPGTHTLTCTAVGPAQTSSFKLHRFNGTGWMTPLMDVTFKGMTYNIRPEEEEQTYGRTIHDSPLGIIHITAGTSEPAQRSSFSIKAIPQTVQAFDTEGNPVSWDLKSENDECRDSNGKAKFKGLFKGYLELNSTTTLEMDAEIMDCELEYNSGMAC